jgi:hypothetical protein
MCTLLVAAIAGLAASLSPCIIKTCAEIVPGLASRALAIIGACACAVFVTASFIVFRNRFARAAAARAAAVAPRSIGAIIHSALMNVLPYRAVSESVCNPDNKSWVNDAK